MPSLLALLLVPLFLSAGKWQWDKAERKAEQQSRLERLDGLPALPVTAEILPAERLHYRKIVARGQYEPQFQILIDNQVHQQRAGYHVITPLRLEGSEVRLLINRGWIPAPADRRQLPVVDAPSATVTINGLALVPSGRFFSLAGTDADPGTEERVWQNLDLPRFARTFGLTIQPVVVQLDPESSSGFAREWPRPDNRRYVNLGYALQWWSFAGVTVILWLYFSFRQKLGRKP